MNIQQARTLKIGQVIFSENIPLTITELGTTEIYENDRYFIWVTVENKNRAIMLLKSTTLSV